jgi:hypothetical protein
MRKFPGTLIIAFITCTASDRLSMLVLEKLHRAFVRLCLFARGEGSKIAPLARSGILFARVQAVLA